MQLQKYSRMVKMTIEKGFLEKYRPNDEKDVVGNEIIKERIFSQVKNKRLVNMILAGGAGLGKTTIAEIIAQIFIGKDNFYTDRVMFNCSDKTGVDNIREGIIEIEKLKPMSGIRIFILEECEQLSKQAQKALKKAMEHPFDKSNRFILLTNDKTKIEDPIKDRCRIYEFMPITPEDMFPRLKYIANNEKIKISDDLIMKLAELSNGSMRTPINRLEEFKALNREITEDDIRMEKSLESIKKIFLLLRDKKIPIARNIVLDLYQEGSNFNDIIRYFHDFTMISMNNITNFKSKAYVLINIAKAERNVKEGCNEFIQLSYLLSKISTLIQKKEEK